CSSAAGEDSPNTENYEETRTTKAEIVEALENGFGYCTEVYGKMTDDMGSNMVSFFGNEMAASAVLAFSTPRTTTSTTATSSPTCASTGSRRRPPCDRPPRAGQIGPQLQRGPSLAGRPSLFRPF
ncbi:MAG: hypothetical protein GWO24_15430, partial [Akkermansiaceae bacterium]|nr:hypothetical protein [Akkermansiaceae bacterium]